MQGDWGVRTLGGVPGSPCGEDVPGSLCSAGPLCKIIIFFLDSSVARDCGCRGIAFISDAVVGRSAARGQDTIVRQNVTFLQISATPGCGESNVYSQRRRLACCCLTSLQWLNI